MKNVITPVLIVGAGPVGLAIAALLRKHGVTARIVERGAGPTPFSKAIGVHARTLEGMHALGLTDQLVSDGHPMHRFRLNEGGGAIMSASFGQIDSPYNFVLGLPQSRTERRLLERFEELGGAVEWNTKLVAVDDLGNPADLERPARVRIEHQDGRVEDVACRWLIGADGSRSSVREMVDIGFPGGDYGNAFILGDVRIDWDGPSNELQFFLGANGYLLLVPMPDGMHRIIAQTDRKYEDFQHGEKPKATLEELQAIVDANGPGGIRVHSPQWLTCAPFYHRRADTCVKERVILAGDAFHLFSPLGAQGLNTGFQDCFNLAWKLAYIEKGWSGVELLDTYKTEREAIARLIANVTSKTTGYITATSLRQRLYRQFITRWYNPTDKVQRLLPRLLAGLMQSYGKDAYLSGESGARLPEAGSRMPHAWMPSGAGIEPLAATVHGTRFTLMLVKNRLDEGAIVALARFWTPALQAQYPFLQVAVVARETGAWMGKLPKGVRLIEDRLGSLFNAINEQPEAMILARPDGFVAFSANGWSFDTVRAYFRDRDLGAAEPVAVIGEEKQEYSHAA